MGGEISCELFSLEIYRFLDKSKSTIIRGFRLLIMYFNKALTSSLSNVSRIFKISNMSSSSTISSILRVIYSADALPYTPRKEVLQCDLKIITNFQKRRKDTIFCSAFIVLKYFPFAPMPYSTEEILSILPFYRISISVIRFRTYFVTS